MSKKQELNPCFRCNQMPGEKDKYCTHCGSPLRNYCSDEPGILGKGCKLVNKPDAAYCASCGEPTIFQLHGLITPVYENKNKPVINWMNNWRSNSE